MIWAPHRATTKSFQGRAAPSQGDVLAFMDNDVIVERTWLHNLT